MPCLAFHDRCMVGCALHPDPWGLTPACPGACPQPPVSGVLPWTAWVDLPWGQTVAHLAPALTFAQGPSCPGCGPPVVTLPAALPPKLSTEPRCPGQWVLPSLRAMAPGPRAAPSPSVPALPARQHRGLAAPGQSSRMHPSVLARVHRGAQKFRHQDRPRPPDRRLSLAPLSLPGWGLG